MYRRRNVVSIKRAVHECRDALRVARCDTDLETPRAQQRQVLQSLALQNPAMPVIDSQQANFRTLAG
ncbi:hypothetical protein Xcc3_17560 [Xanthomonas campestris pv. campestris]|jgi:hypothetical protein|nr:hypothetical protein Xcc3_17560 [Xanthomonas campestris pv. campestris]